MSWLYSILFTGLLISSNSDVAVNNSAKTENAPAPIVVSAADETEVLDKTYPLTANGRVSVSNINGSIVVEAWDRNEVHLVATKIADSKETLSDVDIVVDSRSDSFSVETDYKDWKWKDKNDEGRRRKLEVQFKLSVPRTAMLNEIETVNGSVTLSDFVSFTKASAVNGDVNAGNLRGTASLSTVNGGVVADFDRLETGTKINLSTVNGNVNLTIPSDANATIKADSLNGNITNDFGLPVRKGEYVGRDLYGKVGSGETQIKLNSVNGPLAIKRRNDGKQPNAPTNLLPAKRNSENWDRDDSFDVDVNIDTEKMNRDVARAVRDAKKASVLASKEVAKAMENVKLTELADIKVKVDMKDMEAKIKEGMAAQKEAMAKMRDAMWMGGNPVVERKTNSFQVKGTPKVTIDAKNCNVKVRGWDNAEVKYVLTEFSGRRGRTPSTVTENASPSGVELKVVSADDKENWLRDDNEGARIEVFVPRKSNLKITSDGEIRLEGVSGEIELIGSDGPIDVRGSDGKLKVTNTDGVVRIVGFKGDLVASTGDGDVFLDGDFSTIEGNAADGNFVLTLPPNIDADIQANREHLRVEDIPNGKQVSENNLRLGKGGRKFTFSGGEGSVVLQNRDLISSER